MSGQLATAKRTFRNKNYCQNVCFCELANYLLFIWRIQDGNQAFLTWNCYFFYINQLRLQKGPSTNLKYNTI